MTGRSTSSTTSGTRSRQQRSPSSTSCRCSVLLFPYENKDRVQQMFSDLNRFEIGDALHIENALLAILRCEAHPIRELEQKDRVFALDNRCPHMGFPLDRGSVEDGTVILAVMAVQLVVRRSPPDLPPFIMSRRAPHIERCCR